MKQQEFTSARRRAREVCTTAASLVIVAGGLTAACSSSHGGGTSTTGTGGTGGGSTSVTTTTSLSTSTTSATSSTTGTGGATSSSGTGGAGTGGIGAGGGGAAPLAPICGCAPERKLCVGFGGAICAPLDQPSFGCAADSCFTPCSYANASARCQGGQCALDACADGFADCNLNPADGCEVNLKQSDASCGMCGHACAGGATCTDGICAVGCAPPLTDCGAAGCVNLLTSVTSCGGCAAPCVPPAGQAASCAGGVCHFSGCPAGLTACGGSCIDTQGDPLNCGACGNECPRAALDNASPNNFFPGDQAATSCLGGVCQTCPAGLVSCLSVFPPPNNTSCVDLQRTHNACGGCAASPCAATEVCVSGACAPLTSIALASGLVVDDLQADATHVYWIDAAGGTVSSMPAGGGAPVALATAQAHPFKLALDADHVYYSASLGGAVMRVSKAGGAPEVVAAASQPSELLVDDLNVYWLNTADSTVRSAPKAGGAATVLFDEKAVPGNCGAGAFAAPKLLRQTSTTLVFEMCLNLGASFYLFQVPKAGGNPVKLTFPFLLNQDALGLAVDEGAFYSASLSSPINVKALPGSAAAPYALWFGGLLPTPKPNPMVLDGTSLFFISNGIRKVETCPNQFAFLVLDVPAKLLAVAGGYVYWSDGTRIGRVAE